MTMRLPLFAALLVLVAPAAHAQTPSRFAFTVGGDRSLTAEGDLVLLGAVPGRMTPGEADDPYCLVRVDMNGAASDPDVSVGLSVAVPGGLREGVFPVLVQENRAVRPWADELAGPGAYAVHAGVDHQFGRDNLDDSFYGTGGYVAVEFIGPDRVRARFAAGLSEYGPYDVDDRPASLTLEGEFEHTLRRSVGEAGPYGYQNTYLCEPQEVEPPCEEVRDRLEETVMVRRLFEELAADAVRDGLPALREGAGGSYQDLVSEAFSTCRTPAAGRAARAASEALEGAVGRASDGFAEGGGAVGPRPLDVRAAMATSAETCHVDQMDLMADHFDHGMPLVEWEASLVHERVHQRTCRTMNGCLDDPFRCGESDAYLRYVSTVEGLRDDELAAYDATIAVFEGWLDEHCPSWRDGFDASCR